MRPKGLLSVLFCVVFGSCGGATPSPTDPSAEEAQAQAQAAGADPEAPAKAEGSAKTEATKAAPESPEPAPATATPQTPQINFKPNGSVDDAIKAVPQGLPRYNMADDAIQRPLLNVKQYEACKAHRGVKVSITVAVFDGAAVGVDVSTKPKNAQVEACVDGVVRRMTWQKVPSLNTVTFNF